ncbi:MAG TPA: thioredoxin family protein [Bacteroidota bacterium]|jgi:peroxiredoxin
MNEDQLRIGSSAPTFTALQGVDDKSYSLEDFSSADILVIVFTCNHCPYVQAYEGRMIDFQEKFGPKGLQLIAINSNDTKNYPDDDFIGMVRRARQKGFNFPYLRDENQVVAEDYGATHTPEFFVFDRNRILRYRGKMDDNYQNPDAVSRRYIEDAVEDLLAGKEVRESETHSIGCTIKWRT